MKVRAKFKVDSVTRQKGWGDNPILYSVTLSPVVGDSEENKKFYAATPSGQLTINCVQEVVGKAFDVNAEFYIDLIPTSVDTPEIFQ
jgi:hypothetical protein